MESVLSLDELRISFADHEPRSSADSRRTEDQHNKDSCYLTRENNGHKGAFCMGNGAQKQRKGEMRDFRLEADNAVANKEIRDHHAGKLPDISPNTPSTQLNHRMAWEMGRSRKFCSINVNDFTVGAKPGTFNDLIRREERDKLSASTRRRTDHLSSTESNDYSGGQNWKRYPADDSKSLKSNLTMAKKIYSSKQSVFSGASQRKIFSPRQSLRSSAELKEGGEEFAETLQLDLPEKVTRFIEMEISLIKGKETVNATQKRRGSVFSTYRASESPVGVDLKSIKTRKSWDSVFLDRIDRLYKSKQV